MTLSEIKAAVEAGQTVCWKNELYQVKKDRLDQWLIVCHSGATIGLTWTDGQTMNGEPEDFYTTENFVQERIQRRIYRGEIQATDADGVTTMRDLA